MALVPTVGRIVHYQPADWEGEKKPYPAIIVAVHSPLVDLQVFGPGQGNTWWKQDVPLQTAPGQVQVWSWPPQ